MNTKCIPQHPDFNWHSVCLSPVIFEPAYIIYLFWDRKAKEEEPQSTYKTSKKNKQKWTIKSKLCVIISTITPMWYNSVAGSQDLWPTESLSAGSDEDVQPLGGKIE